MTTWTWLGDHLALDFANTTQEQGGTMVDLIPTLAEFEGWRSAMGDRLPEVGELTPSQLDDLRSLRDSALALMHAALGGSKLPEPDLAAVNEAVRSTSTSRLLVQVGRADAIAGHHEGAEVLRGVLAAAVVDLLAREDLANLAVCHAPGCGQFFHRARPNQRWCSPGCGNRARVDRHRHRRARPAGEGQ